MPAKKTAEEPTYRRVQVDCSQDGRTHQSFKEECDINTVMKRHAKTGVARQNTQRPQYGDFSNLPDYQEAMNTVIRAEAQFAELPATVRGKFNNDPAQFLAFCDDPDNQDQAVELGIAARPEPEPEPEPAPRDENPIIGGE